MKKIKLFTDSSVNPQEKIGFGAYLFFDEKIIWLASGGLMGINERKLDDLSDREIILFPDLSAKSSKINAFEEWKSKAELISENLKKASNHIMTAWQICLPYISHNFPVMKHTSEIKWIDISKEQRKEYVDFIINKAFEYYKNEKDIDLVTGNMEMDAIMLLNRFKQEYPSKVDILEKKLKSWGGNSAGNRLGNMDWLGNVKPDPFFPFIIGNYLQTPFDEIWTSTKNDILNKLREAPRQIKGKCSDCKYIEICNGGSRSRAFAITGDLWEEDPSCYLDIEEIRR